MMAEALADMHEVFSELPHQLHELQVGVWLAVDVGGVLWVGQGRNSSCVGAAGLQRGAGNEDGRSRGCVDDPMVVDRTSKG